MFILRSSDPGSPIHIKTPVGHLHVVFADEQDARAYVSAMGIDRYCNAEALVPLLQREPRALGSTTRAILLPSLDVASELHRDPATFPYEQYIVDAASSPR